MERFWKQHRVTGQCRPKQIGGYRRSRLEKHDRTLRRWIAAQADLTLNCELQSRCREQLNVSIGTTALWHRLEQLGLSYKKNDAPPSKVGPDVKANAPGSFGAGNSPAGMMSAGWCLLMKLGLNTKLARHYGRCPLGQRCINAIPHGHWQSSTFIAALRHDSIEAPFLIEGPVDAEVFPAYLEQVLCPQLHTGDILILDNLATHKIQIVRQLLSARGVGVRTTCRPTARMLNPIELAFAIAQSALRQAAARSLEDALFGPGKLPRLLLADPFARGLSARPYASI